MTDSKYREAKRRVKAKKDFYSHLGSYLVMSGFFFLLNAVTSFGHWWFYWPMLGWGLAVMFHYVDVFGIPGVAPMNEEWEEREIEREVRRLEESESREERLDLPDLDKHAPPPKVKEKRWDDSDLV